MRIIYNTSFIVDVASETAWIAFMREHYIAPLQTHRLCDDIIFTKVSIEQPDGKTYSLQLVFQSPQQQEHFMKQWLPLLEERLIRHYASHYLCFSSILTEI